MSEDMWTYRAQLVEVVDGDTFDLRLDLGFRTYKKIRVRLLGVDTAEIFGVEKESTEYKRGMEHKRFVKDFLTATPDDEGWPLTFVSAEESGKYGRWLGDVRVDDELLSDALIESWPEVEK